MNQEPTAIVRLRRSNEIILDRGREGVAIDIRLSPDEFPRV
jgi:hypothetical protein